jgi:ferredoxin
MSSLTRGYSQIVRVVRSSVSAMGSSSVMAKKSTASLSTVADATIHLTFVDNEGNRASVPALTGSTIMDVAKMHGIDLESPCGGGGGMVSQQKSEDWEDTLYGEGPMCFFCHVQIPSSYNSILPPMGETDEAGLESVWGDEISKQSRLACQITLDKRHNNMVVFVPDAPPADVI